MISPNPTITAVSAFSIKSPSDIIGKFLFLKKSNSFCENPPSGPIITSIFSAFFIGFLYI